MLVSSSDYFGLTFFAKIGQGGKFWTEYPSTNHRNGHASNAKIESTSVGIEASIIFD